MSLEMSDYASDWQIARITRLLDERAVTGRMASRIITMLEDSPKLGNAVGHNKDIAEAVKERIKREP